MADFDYESSQTGQHCGDIPKKPHKFYSRFQYGSVFLAADTRRFLLHPEEKRKAIVPVVFVHAYMATVFGGPCALFRYALPHIACLPALMAMVYRPRPASDESVSAPGTGR